MLLLGDINAGFPSAAEGYEDNPLDLHALLVRNPAATFFYTVNGDELRDEHIRHNSILVVDRSMRPARGKLVVTEDAGEFIVCRYKQQSFIVGVVTAVVTRF